MERLTRKGELGLYVVEYNEATQYATIYRDGQPIGTACRKRVLDKGPAWTLCDIHGKQQAAGRLTLGQVALGTFIRRLESAGLV